MKYKILNSILLGIVFFAGLETSLSLLGRLALIENDFVKARTYLSLVRDRQLLGLVYYKQEKFEEAYNYYKKRKNWRGMGWAYYGMGKYEEAQDYFKRVNDYAGLGQVKLAQGNYAEAKQIFSETQEHSGIGLTYLADNDFINAKESFIRAGDTFGLGLTYLAKGDFESAKKVFSKSSNKTVLGLISLIDKEYDKAQKIFERLNDHSLLASFHRLRGNFEKAIQLYLEANNEKQASRLLLKTGKINMANELSGKTDDVKGQGDLYYHLGDYERAFELYDKCGAYEDAYNALMVSGNAQQALKYGKKIFKQNPEEINVQLKIAETLRLTHEYRNAEFLVQKLSEIDALQAEALVMKNRLDITRGVRKSLQTDLQEAVNLSGQGFLSRQILEAARLLDIPIKPPKEETVEILVTGKPLTLLKVVGLALLLLFAAVGVLYFLRRRTGKTPMLEEIQVGYKGISQTHKQIYSHDTSLKLSTMDKIKKTKTGRPSGEEKKSEPLQETIQRKPAEEEISVPITEEVKGRIESPGVQILQMALKKLEIDSTSSELVELSGEESGKLTVYGIYLAARAKGAQVQGIKVDIDYLLDASTGIHLVFFQDESFALLHSIAENKVELVMGKNEIAEFSMSDFQQRWNGYVITFSKF